MTFPAEMLVDYVRVYQRVGKRNIGCSPKDYPTEDYINRNLEAYTSLSCLKSCTSSFLLTASLHVDPQLKYWSTGPASANNTWPKNGNVRVKSFRSLDLPNITLERAVQWWLLATWINTRRFVFLSSTR